MYGQKSLKGFFNPQNPQKYKGDATQIVYRSSWELKFLLYLDKHPDVIEYSSEEIIIPYLSPVDGKYHRYFPDFFVKMKTKDNKVKNVLIEIKPQAQTIEPVKKNKINRTYINEVFTWGVNQAKWEAAKEYCKKRNWDFMILTEKDLGIKY